MGRVVKDTFSIAVLFDNFIIMQFACRGMMPLLNFQALKAVSLGFTVCTALFCASLRLS